MRTTAVGPRFGWIVGTYEIAHGAFLLGALFGALVTTGVLDGAWSGAVRIAHLHVNLLGWAGLTLLATIVFFGPTIARTRIRESADVRAARAVRLGAIGLGIGVAGTVMIGPGGAGGVAARLIAAAGLAVFAWAVTVVSIPVARASVGAKAPDRWSIVAVAAWFLIVGWFDVAVVATGEWRLLDVVGAAMLVGVLAQAIVTSLGYVAPRLLHLDPAAAVPRTEHWGAGRAVVWNGGVVLIVSSGIADPGAPSVWSSVGSVGWALVLLAIGARLLVVAWATRSVGAP